MNKTFNSNLDIPRTYHERLTDISRRSEVFFLLVHIFRNIFFLNIFEIDIIVQQGNYFVIIEGKNYLNPRNL